MQNQGIRNLRLVDDVYMYCLMNGNLKTGKTPGFYYHNLEKLTNSTTEDDETNFRL